MYYAESYDLSIFHVYFAETFEHFKYTYFSVLLDMFVNLTQ